MSLRGNGGGGGNNRGRRGGGGSNSEGAGRIFEKSGNLRNKDGSSGSVLTTASPNPGQVKILQSRRKEDAETKASTPGIIPNILQSAASTSSAVPKIAVRPKKESEEKQTPTIPSLPSLMPVSIKFFDESNNLNKSFLDCLTALNSNFNIVAIIGAQGSGKSTFASMLSGNETNDLYGEYIFRPSPREFVEKGASQTTSINVYVTKNRTIVFDCQAINSGHIFELALRSSRREGIKLSQVVKYYEDETQKLLMLLFEICHTIILGIDWFVDLNIIREIMTADLSYRKLKSNYGISVRKINLVIAQLRARSVDFQPEVVAERTKIIKGMFDGTRFDVCGGLSMKKLGFETYSYANPDINYVLFAEIKPRSKLDQIPLIEDNYGLMSIPFNDVMEKFELNLLSLPRPNFQQQTGKINEREWFQNIVIPSWEKLLSSELTSFSRK